MRAKSQLSATLAAIPTLEATIDAARQRIRVLTGRPRSEALELPPCETAVNLPDPPALSSPGAVVGERPDVRSAARQLTASTAFVDAARAEYLPKLSLAGAAGYTGSEARALGDAGTPRYAIGPVLSWPAFDLGRVRANVSEGGSDFLQVLDAQRTLLERENERAAGRTEAETNLIAVYRALGGGNGFR